MNPKLRSSEPVSQVTSTPEGSARISSFRTEAAVAPLTSRLKDKDVRCRQTAVTALGQIGPAAKRAVPDLIALLKDEAVRETAAIALGSIGKEAVPELVTALAMMKSVRGRLIMILGGIGPDAQEAVGALKDIAENENWAQTMTPNGNWIDAAEWSAQRRRYTGKGDISQCGRRDPMR